MTFDKRNMALGLVMSAGVVALAAGAVAQVAPPLPPAPLEPAAAVAPPAPPAPPVPPVPPVAALSDGHQKHRVIVMRDGKRGAQTIIDADKIERDAMTQAINGIRSAREAIAGNTALSDDVRREVLQELDAEIAKLQAKS